jgi:hypothetical protein
MKLIILIFSLAFAGVHMDLQAQVEQQTETPSQDNKELIDQEELPEIVLQEFDQSVYKQWSIDKVYKIEASNETSYELHLTQPGETMVLVADAQGQLQPKADPKADL